MAVEICEFTYDKPVTEPYLLNITSKVRSIVSKSKVKNGVAIIFINSTTTGIRIMKYTKDTKAELTKVLEVLAPSDMEYMHHKLAGDVYGIGADTNGKSHVRSAFFGPSVTVPIISKKIPLGKNSIVAMDFDVIKRKRRVIVQMLGR
ncbi:MAG: secondary thiamine-phosphate synthase enzyme YjbQ [Candidatus Marsarchaeota archaeon]|nr:secondary thiamine-phosphate synthase enzyme YjbQ [Candidatus Marsarchaeota archaeon]